MKRKHTENIVSFASRTSRRISSLLLIIIALLPLFSALITAYHYHADLRTHPDCAVCKSAEDLSSGDKQEPLSFIPQELLIGPCFCEMVAFRSDNLINSINNRAPPRSHFL